MARTQNLDIIIEILELTDELIKEIRQDLLYFRASVYKSETAPIITQKIQKLRVIAEVFPDRTLEEAFLDFDAELANAATLYVPGECSFTARTTRLLNSLDALVMRNRTPGGSIRLQSIDESDGLAKKIRMKRSELLSACQHGSRRWNFFQGL
jgi:hypothetical protein